MSSRPTRTSRPSAGLTIATSALAAALLAGCGGGLDLFAGNEYFAASKMGVKASPRVTTSRNVPKGGGRYHVGQPYTVAGQRFVPQEQPNLDVTGRASWYGPAFHGRLTANGEVFDMNHLSGAHPTLPLPSYVRVTNLDNGHSTLVRINDRGPFSNGRVIDLSRRTAEVLGYANRGTANVRVQYVGPAPLEGDDTRFLVASINQLTPYEINTSTTRMAFNDTQPAPSALGAVESAAPAVPADIPFQILSYGGSGTLSLDTIDEINGTAVDFRLGSFDQTTARRIAEAFAVLGAVDEVSVTHGDQTSVSLALVHLREGVTTTDAEALARSLGLNDAILY
ncbi:septal ring lytic transglycosylase RlpA family protein [Pelagibacterium limicola]|uniref:septal ring lytic transglycosylase RlpA family protein n=1 Tax=Pelagibacterium limicola TaxID=2791022 RepID=UPI0018AFE362|nr:septal ring lytic transglycosylase RlpA family protein [Pelagibacterium limicola]